MGIRIYGDSKGINKTNIYIFCFTNHHNVNYKCIILKYHKHSSDKNIIQTIHPCVGIRNCYFVSNYYFIHLLKYTVGLLLKYCNGTAGNVVVAVVVVVA